MIRRPVNNFQHNLECAVGYYLYRGKCLQECPDQFYPTYINSLTSEENDNQEEISVRHSICLPCHYMCRNCIGSNDYQCTSCYPDAVLVSSNDLESYCYPHSIVYNLQAEKWYFRVYILFWVILVIVIIILIRYIIKEKQLRKKLKNQVLNFATVQNIRKMEHNVKRTVYSDSE